MCTTAISLCGLFGVKIIVTCGSDEKCSAALKAGATHAINYAASDFVEAVLKITAGHGVQAVLDMVGGDYVARNLACLAEDGRPVSIAPQRGANSDVPLIAVIRRRLTLTGSHLRPHPVGFNSI